MKEPKKSFQSISEVEDGVQRSVERLRIDLLREARTCAIDALHKWVSWGVEWCNASRGAIFLLDRHGSLNSIAGVAVRTKKKNLQIKPDEFGRFFAGRILCKNRGDYSDRVRDEPHFFLETTSTTKSVIAVPLYDENGPEVGEIIGVYELEADLENAFFPTLVQELQKNMALLTVHLLVLKKCYDRKHQDEPWIWHPEVHGWKPGKLIERFCHVVVKGAGKGKASPPTCSIWNTDQKSKRCWVLGACDYDYDFQSALALDEKSVTWQVAQQPIGTFTRGTPDERRLYNLDKARRMRVGEVLIASISNPSRGVSGTINIYSVDKSTELPGFQLMDWLCERASEFVADIYSMRNRLGVAYICGQLSKAAAPTPNLGVLREAIGRVLPFDAASLFVASRSVDATQLVALDSTGFQLGAEPSAATFSAVCSVSDDESTSSSITEHCFKTPTPVRINFASEFHSSNYRVPQPSNQYPEILMRGDSDHRSRRRLGIRILKPTAEAWEGHTPSGSRQESVGVIRLYRSRMGRPFTSADAELLEAVASIGRCRRLFEIWSFKQSPSGSLNLELDPDIPIPPSRSVIAELHDALKNFNRTLFTDLTPHRTLPFSAGLADENTAAKSEDSVRRATLFVLRGNEYVEFVCYPQHEIPPITQMFAPEGSSETGIQEIVDRNDRPMFRAWVKLRAWSGEHLMRTILTFDVTTRNTATLLIEDQSGNLHTTLNRIASRLTTNTFYPELSPHNIIAEFQSYAESISTISSTYFDTTDAPSRSLPGQSLQHQKNRRQQALSLGQPDHEGSRDLMEFSETLIFSRAEFSRFEAAIKGNFDDWVCPDPELDDYEVRIEPKGKSCFIPLRTGRSIEGILLCEFSAEFSARVKGAIESAASFGDLGIQLSSSPQNSADIAVWSHVRCGIGAIIGAWTRVVVPILEATAE